MYEYIKRRDKPVQHLYILSFQIDGCVCLSPTIIQQLYILFFSLYVEIDDWPYHPICWKWETE
jgi:hypothetical protein